MSKCLNVTAAPSMITIRFFYSVIGLYYRDLIISVTGKDINGKLIQALIAVYLGDDARTDAISARLREVSPGLYNQDDALSSKAQEILIKARNQTNPLEKEKMITEAINICKDVAAKLNLEVLIRRVTLHDFFGKEKTKWLMQIKTANFHQQFVFRR